MGFRETTIPIQFNQLDDVHFAVQGPHAVIAERGDADESLIDPIHGHGSQSLINLLLTGSATQNVFDGTKDLCGLQLQGIEKQASVGFLSYLECLRYLEVYRK